MTSVGFGDIGPANILERVLCIVIVPLRLETVENGSRTIWSTWCFGKGSLFDVIRSSSCLPFLFTKVMGAGLCWACGWAKTLIWTNVSQNEWPQTQWRKNNSAQAFWAKSVRLWCLAAKPLEQSSMSCVWDSAGASKSKGGVTPTLCRCWHTCARMPELSTEVWKSNFWFIESWIQQSSTEMSDRKDVKRDEHVGDGAPKFMHTLCIL